MAARRLLIAYALVNALLYSTLLPLWEGFDEPFHFGYAQQLASGQGLPDARTARLSGEVGASLLLAPASPPVKQNLPQVISFGDFFSWPESRRQEIRKQLDQLPPDLRLRSSQFLNYEAQHPPLAYLLLAVPERIFARVPLPARVAILRIIAAGAGALFLLAGAERLFSQLGLAELYKTAALFCTLSSQMLWATLAHVGNDWLAVPLAVWTLVALNRTGYRAAFYLAAGLLTKAYFLCLIPLLIGVYALQRRWRDLAIASAILCGIAGPWYARNVLLYGDLTGMQEGRAGIGIRAVVRNIAMPHWPAVIGFTARTSVWTGNNSFRTFSSGTVDLILGAGILALILWAASRHTRAEWITCGYCALFLAAMGYYTVVSCVHTHGASKGPEPWYAQVLLAPLLGLAMLGASRFGTPGFGASGWRSIGPLTAAILVLISGYILSATYFVKLIPLYGGYEARTSLAGVASLYIHQAGTLSSNLNTVTMAPAAVIFLLSGAIVVLIAIQQIALIGRLFSSWSEPGASSAQRLSADGAAAPQYSR